tara:strand:+ start:109 stop:759 length:651 start_codon:yes stop_codon:yes gene_type:complete
MFISPQNKINVLVLSPHTDDGELGAGGFISKLVNLNCKVSYIAFSSCEESVPEGFPKDILAKEAKEATSILGIKSSNLKILDYKVREFGYHRQKILDDLIKIRNEVEYSLVLIPSLKDVHQDHQVVSAEAVRAFKNTCTILSYDLPWNNVAFNSQCFVELDKEEADNKFKALSCYKSQGHRIYMQEDSIFSLMKYKGMQKGCEFAESFEVVRWFIS